jgi:hypothetical protein
MAIMLIDFDQCLKVPITELASVDSPDFDADV